MNRGKNSLLAVLVVLTTAIAAYAKPQLFVNYEGLGGIGHRWSVSVAPDPAFFSNTTSGFGSSLAVELAFRVEGGLIGAGTIVENNVDWPADNPGNNPFTDSNTDGLWLAPNFDRMFGAFGGNVFLTGAPVPLFNFQTAGTNPTTIHYGVAASGDPLRGSIISQTGQNFPAEFAGFGTLALDGFGGSLAGDPDPGVRRFTGYTGSVNSVPEPAAAALILVAAFYGWCTRSRGRR